MWVRVQGVHCRTLVQGTGCGLGCTTFVAGTPVPLRERGSRWAGVHALKAGTQCETHGVGQDVRRSLPTQQCTGRHVRRKQPPTPLLLMYASACGWMRAMQVKHACPCPCPCPPQGMLLRCCAAGPEVLERTSLYQAATTSAHEL